MAAFVAKAATSRLSFPHRAARWSSPESGRGGSRPIARQLLAVGAAECGQTRRPRANGRTIRPASVDSGEPKSTGLRGREDSVGRQHSPRVAGRGSCLQLVGISRLLPAASLSPGRDLTPFVPPSKACWLSNERPFKPPLPSYSPVSATETWLFPTQGVLWCHLCLARGS